MVRCTRSRTQSAAMACVSLRLAPPGRAAHCTREPQPSSSPRPRADRSARPRNRLLVPAPRCRGRGAAASGRRLPGRDERSRLHADPRPRRFRQRGRAVGAEARRREAARGAARDDEDARLRRAHADRAAAEEDLVLHAVPRRGGDRDRARARARAGRHELPDLSAAGAAPRARRRLDGRADVPAPQQRARPAQGPPAAGDVLVQARRLLHDLGQPRDAVHPGGRLGNGVGDQGRHAGSPRRGSATARPPSPTSTPRSPSPTSTARR